MYYPPKSELAGFSQDVFAAQLALAIPGMKQHEQEALLVALKHCKKDEDFWFLHQYMLHPETWRMPMVSIDTFIEDEFYLGKMTNKGKGVYPLLRKVARDIIEGNYNEVSAVCGLGSGKSFIASLIATYVTHHLVCLRQPHKFYKLIADKPIGVMNMGLTATQATKVVFESIKNFVMNSQFFKQLEPVEKQGIIQFKKEMVELIAGNSKASSQLGYNIFCGILDEAAFYYEAPEGQGDASNNEKTSVAQGIYEGLKGRIASRFGDSGLLMMISSPRTLNDFIMKKKDDAFVIDPLTKTKMFPRVYGIQFPTWKVKDPSVYAASGTFLFNAKNNSVVTEALEEVEKLYEVNKLSDPEFSYDKHIWEIPDAFKVDFIKNPDKAKRDIGALPSEAIDGFLIPERIHFNMERLDPVVGNGNYSFRERPLRTSYYIHIDIGLNRNGVGDFTGFVMGHADGFEKDEATGENRLKIKIDIVERIGVSEGKQEVDISEIRERIYTLKAMGYNIALVTLDQFQSKEMLQILRKKSVRAEYLSVDRTVDPYNMLKEAFYEQRLDVYYNEHLHRELVQLEAVYSGSHMKIDHPRTGCFTGDTRVALANGTCPTFEELCNTPGPHYVYSIGPTGVEIRSAIKPRITKYTDELVEVMLDNYQVIRCTPEHRFMTLDKEWVEAQNITPEVSLMPLYRSVSLVKGGWQGYERVYCPVRNKRIMTHHLSFPDKKEGYHIHHKDENKLNNYPENLEEISNIEHTSKHSTERWEGKRVAMREGHTKYYEDETKREEQRQRILKSWEEGKFGPRRQKCCIEGCEALSDAKGMCDVHYQRNRRARLRAEKKGVQEANHRVIYVKRIKLEQPVPVYDISVPETENFALACGVFVHNSKDISDALAGCIYNIVTHTPYTTMNMSSPVDTGAMDPNIIAHIEEQKKLKAVETKIRMNEKQQALQDRIRMRMR